MRDIRELSFYLKNSRLIQFLIIKMNGQFKIKETNYYGYLDPDSCSLRFRPWIRFLNEQCLASTAITASADIQVQPLYDFYSTAVNSTTLDNYKIIGEIRGGKRITITTDDVNRILGFSRNNFLRFRLTMS